MSTHEAPLSADLVPAGLRVEDLSGHYGTLQALHDLSFSVAPGGGLALLGRNGMGKTSTFRALTGLGIRASGSIMLGDEELGNDKPYRRARAGLSLVFEDRRILPHLNVEENLLMGYNAANQRPAPSLEQIYDGLPLLGELRKRGAGVLSGGEQQLLAVARAICGAPRVLLLDEPAEGLAPVIVERLLQAIEWIRGELGTTLIVAEHKLWFTRQCTEQVLLLSDGHIVFKGDWAGFDADPNLMHRYLSVG